MGDRTGISWTNSSWNPIRGCTRVSQGCVNCYAEGQAARFSGPGQPYEGLAKFVTGTDGSKVARWTGEVAFVEKHLDDPLRWQKPRRIFVNSMSDLFHEKIPDEWIDRIFAVMALAPRHTFQVLTKRPERMLAYCAHATTTGRVWAQAGFLAGNRAKWDGNLLWPLPNVWLGVSAEDQKTANERIPLLLQTPAAVRWISAEPLLGPIDLAAWPNRCWLRTVGSDGAATRPGLDWVVVGGESGPKARPMHPDWARSIRDQCAAAGTAFFFKQWGRWHETYDRDRDDPDWQRCDVVMTETPKGIWHNVAGGQGFHGDRVVRMVPRAKHEDATLDGKAWAEYPGATA